MDPSRVLGHVAADGTGDLGGGIGGIEEAMERRGLGNLRIANTRFHRGCPVNRVDMQNAIEPREGQQYPFGMGQRAAREPGAGTAGHDRHAQAVA